MTREEVEEYEMTEKERFFLACVLCNSYKTLVTDFESLSHDERMEIEVKSTQFLESQDEDFQKEMSENGVTFKFLAYLFYDDLQNNVPLTQDKIRQEIHEGTPGLFLEVAKRFVNLEDFEEIVTLWGGEISVKMSKNEILRDIFLDVVLEGIQIDTKYLSMEEKDNIFRLLDETSVKWGQGEDIPTYEELEKESQEKGLPFKEFLFCEEFMKTGNVSKTAKSLGMGRTSCHAYLNKTEVKEYLQRRQKEKQREFDEELKVGYMKGFKQLEKMFDNYDHGIRAIDVYLKHFENRMNKNNITEE